MSNYTNKDAAAVAWTLLWGSFSVQAGYEVFSFIYRVNKKTKDGTKKEFNFTAPVNFRDISFREHNSPFNRETTEKALGEEFKIVGFIHSHGKWGKESDNYFSGDPDDKTQYQKKGILDIRNIRENGDIDHYLANPKGQLKVWRSGSNIGSQVLGWGFWHDEKVEEYGRNARPLKWELEPEIYNPKPWFEHD